MNERPSVNRLREAMRNADYTELEALAVSIGREAVEDALAEAPPPPPPPPPVPATAPERYKPNEEEERERLQDAAFADAIEMVNRHRLRLGRRVCSRPDATTTRKIFELLRAMAGADGGADGDPSFQ